MIIRRISGHVKRHDWFAVGVDFVIVVIGVFVANQVTILNERRLERRAETEIIVQLRADVAAATAELQRRTSNGRDSASRDAMVRSLTDSFFGDQKAAMDQDACRSIGELANITNLVRPLAGAEELVTGGALSRITDRRVNALVSDYHDFRRYSEHQFARYSVLLAPLDVDFPQYFGTEPYWDDESQSIRIRGTCEPEALRADPAFKIRLARAIDYHNSWSNLFIAEYGRKLAALQAALDEAAHARGLVARNLAD